MATSIAVAGRSVEGKPHNWHVETEIEGLRTEADVDVLVWSDIVRDSMLNSIPATYWQLVRTAWTYIASGAFRRVMRLRKGPVIAALYPIGMLLLQLALATLIGWGSSALVAWIVDSLLGLTGVNLPAIAHGARLAVGLALAVWILRWFKKKDGKFFAYYLMHDYAYSARWKGGNPPELEERMAAFGETITAAFAALSQLRVTRNVFRETLRLYPPVPMMVRETVQPEEFRKRVVRKGAQVVLSPWHLHRHERLWDRPDIFDPSRWDDPASQESQRQAYMPFSAGPRVCTGARFAMVEGFCSSRG